MKRLPDLLRPALISNMVLAFVLCGLYPLAVGAFAQLMFPRQANGSLLRDASGTVLGSALIGQSFTAAKYFHPRPSAAGGAPGYDAANSGGSNLGPSSRKLCETIRERIATYRSENNLGPGAPVPADAVTASASGLDPHISIRNAEIQSLRVASTRGLGIEAVQRLIRECTEGPDWGIFGEPGVNVLKLNLALDSLK